MTSASQTEQSKMTRGDDYSTAETDRALAHMLDQQKLAKARMLHLSMLAGNAESARSLRHKTMALTNAPPYEEYP